MRRAWELVQRHPGVRAARYELSLYRDLARWMRGRVEVPAGAAALPHQPGRLQMLGFLTAIMLVEIVAVHLLLPPGTVRIVAFVVSVWGVVFVWALVASERVRPSYVTDEEIVLRRGRKVFAAVPRETVAAVRRDRSFASDVALGDGELALGGPAGTDLFLELREPVDAAHDTYPWQKVRTEPVTRLRFYAGGVEL
ncbi:hypothetical protein M5J20_07580 [Corynebacterium sp. TA-R-1]|uniref:Uncharacterized protein n=1 Tax=Corynebacterium stercoris TaxID=2943490 RepID=A0ABT1G200_9CORY|nr:hypothetical protein [Corynebacterium stercoris]MCP1388051.1 hypothetical protein [Corynebacterium stercoris]